MKQLASIRQTSVSQARRWARRLARRTQSILAANPQADGENVRHTLILLELSPLERLQRSLIRGRQIAANRAKDQLAIPVLRDALAAALTVKRKTHRKRK